MGVPRPDFSSAGRLRAAQAAVLVDAAMARAQAALHREQARHGRQRVVANCLRDGIQPWFECVAIGAVVLVCLTGWLVHGWT